MKTLMLFLSWLSLAHAEPMWVMTKNSSPLSYYVEFNCFKDNTPNGSVIRSGLFTPRYYYDLYSPEKAFMVRAINRVISLGFFAPNQMEFDIYDEMNGYVGYIGGKFWTNGPAKFIFTNAAGVETGSALLGSDSDRAIFTLLSPTNTMVGKLKGDLSGDWSSWKLDLQQPLEIDPRALKIFTAFISDFHDSFIRKPEIHNHIYIQQNNN